MKACWIEISMFGTTPGLWRTLLNEQGERDLRALLKLIAEAKPTDGEDWRGSDSRVPNLVRIVAMDGTDLWLCPWRIVAISFGKWFEPNQQNPVGQDAGPGVPKTEPAPEKSHEA